MAGEISSVFIPGPVGQLEALLNAGAPGATHAALVCHPHPLHGGAMHNKVVFAAMKALNTLGLPVLRFNFRGTGLSEGEHDFGRGEVDDVKAALHWLEQRFALPIIFAGFSFGAATGLRACCPEERVRALISLGTPVAVQMKDAERVYAYGYLAQCAKPKLFISGTEDPFGPRPQLERVFALAAEPKQVHWVQGAEHFFAGRLDEVRAAIQQWVQPLL